MVLKLHFKSCYAIFSNQLTWMDTQTKWMDTCSL